MNMSDRNYIGEQNLLSVIIPAYNCEDTIEKCVTSIVSGCKGISFEIIAINDGSTDGTLHRLNALSEKHSELKVISQANAGLSPSRNVGLDVAVGKYIYFIDSDDFLALNSLPQAIMHMEQSGCVMCEFAATKYISYADAKEKEIETTKEMGFTCFDTLESYAKSGLFREMYLTYVTKKIFLNNIIQKHNLRFESQLTYAEDLTFIRRFLMYREGTISVATKNAAKYYYVQHSNSITHRRDLAHLKRLYMNYFQICQIHNALMSECTEQEPTAKYELHFSRSLYAYLHFSIALSSGILSKNEVMENYKTACRENLLPIDNFFGEKGFPSAFHNKVMRFVINTPFIYKTLLFLRYIVKKSKSN